MQVTASGVDFVCVEGRTFDLGWTSGQNRFDSDAPVGGKAANG